MARDRSEIDYRIVRVDRVEGDLRRYHTAEVLAAGRVYLLDDRYGSWRVVAHAPEGGGEPPVPYDPPRELPDFHVKLHLQKQVRALAEQARGTDDADDVDGEQRAA